MPRSAQPARGNQTFRLRDLPVVSRGFTSRAWPLVAGGAAWSSRAESAVRCVSRRSGPRTRDVASTDQRLLRPGLDHRSLVISGLRAEAGSGRLRHRRRADVARSRARARLRRRSDGTPRSVRTMNGDECNAPSVVSASYSSSAPIAANAGPADQPEVREPARSKAGTDERDRRTGAITKIAMKMPEPSSTSPRSDDGTRS